MLFKGIGRSFSTENDQQYETIGVFWDELAAKYGRENLQGLGYGWKARSIEYVIGLIDGEIDGENRTVTLPDMGWVTVRGRTAELGKIYEKLIRKADWNMRSSALPTAVTVRSCIADQPTGTSEEA